MILAWGSASPAPPSQKGKASSPPKEPHGKGFHGAPLLQVSKQLGMIRPLQKVCT